MIIQYQRLREDAIAPTRGHPSDAGLDVYYCPPNHIIPRWINPGRNALLQTGLKFEIPHGYMLEVKNRSSVASKRGLLVGACVIDSGYDGEVFINFHNVGVKKQFIESGMKIAQLVMVPVVAFRAQEKTTGPLYEEAITISNRGQSALGSTGE